MVEGKPSNRTILQRSIVRYENDSLTRAPIGEPRIGSLLHLVFEGDAFRIVLRKPFFGGLFAGKDLDMVDVADILAGVDIDQDGLHWSLLSLRFPQ